MSVQAVTTTGIYCVPSCSARPHPANVVRYGSPAAAEAAGFPGLGPWTAGVIALRLGEPDTFPTADLGLRRAANPGGEALTTTELITRAEAWRPHRAAAALRLWLSESGG